MRPAENIENSIKRLQVTPSAEMRRRTLDDILEAQEESRKTKPAVIWPDIWRTIMKKRITKLAAAAVIIIAVFLGLDLIVGPNTAGVAWGEVLENICNSKTLTCLMRAKEDGPPIGKIMTIDPYLLRCELLGEQQIAAARIWGGQILVADTGKGKGLILDIVKKTAKMCPADKEMLPIYDTFRNFRNRVGFSVDEIGGRQIGDKQAIGFKLRKTELKRGEGKCEIIVWADSETKLPILMEETLENREGQVEQFVVTDIVFDAELDVSLFSVKPPEGYKLEELNDGRGVELAKRTMSIANVHRILMACKKYVTEHNGQWPDSLQELTKYGVDKETFVNPRQPALEVGYIYLKPPAFPAESRIVLYGAYDTWNGGISVGFADYHVEFMKDESGFKKQLKEPLQRK